MAEGGEPGYARQDLLLPLGDADDDHSVIVGRLDGIGVDDALRMKEMTCIRKGRVCMRNVFALVEECRWMEARLLACGSVTIFSTR